MGIIIDETEARLSLRLAPAGESLEDDMGLADKMAQAEAIYFAYDDKALERWEVVTSPVTSPPMYDVPQEAKTAVLILLKRLWDNRGEDPLGPAHNLMRLIRGHVAK
jgi:hypothetical protein